MRILRRTGTESLNPRIVLIRIMGTVNIILHRFSVITTTAKMIKFILESMFECVIREMTESKDV